ncbi:MAG TPA: response regulator [Alphaproteobacteria bacterium]|nr:response regulator [Alphaproteobacteria bacterium]
MRGLRVLIAEDEGLVATGLKAQLKAIGHQVVGMARDGEEAVALAATAQPDLILMDIRLPRLDGLEAARRILQVRRIPIIFVSAYSEATLAQAASEIGGFAYLRKPVDRLDLLPAIEVALGRFREAEALRRAVQDLEQAIELRKRVEQAKGILMRRLQIPEPEAMRRLQQRSRQERKPLGEVVAEVITADAFFASWERERHDKRAE